MTRKHRDMARATRGGRQDFIQERAEFMQWRNHPELAARDGYLPTLGIASKFRAVAVAPMAWIVRAERSAQGHVDYQRKFVLYCAELASKV